MESLGFFSCYDSSDSEDSDDSAQSLHAQLNLSAAETAHGNVNVNEPLQTGHGTNGGAHSVQIVEHQTASSSTTEDLRPGCTTTPPASRAVSARETTSADINNDPGDSSDSETESRSPAPKNAKRQKLAIQETSLPPQLATFLKELDRFWTKEHLLARQAPAIARSTFGKVKERILCFLGFVEKENQQLEIGVFRSPDLVERYLDFLKDVRGLHDSTISNHCSALIYATKFVYRSKAPKYDDVVVISQLRSLATRLQRKGDLQRTQTRDELRERQQWLDWEEILEVLQMQRQRFDVCKNGIQKAKEMQDLCILSIYCQLPPSRAQEIRTLEIVKETPTRPFVLEEHRGKNIVVFRECGTVSLRYEDFKTKTSKPPDQIDLTVDQELPRLLKEFLNDHRPKLIPSETAESSCRYFFVNKSGEPFSSSAFTCHVQGIFTNLCGVKISVNALRASFVTWAYSSKECTDSMKDSLAAALRHTRRQAQTTYDKRTSNEKKAEAIDLCRKQAEICRNVEKEALAPKKANKMKPGEFVGLVETGSSLKNPKVLIGRINYFTEEGDASLLWYKGIGKNTYKMELCGMPWTEGIDALVPVEVTESSLGGLYKLVTSLRSIHKSVFKS